MEIRKVKLAEEGIWKELNIKVDAIAESVKKPVGFNELLANFGVQFPEDPFWWWVSFLVCVVPTGAFFIFRFVKALDNFVIIVDKRFVPAYKKLMSALKGALEGYEKVLGSVYAIEGG